VTLGRRIIIETWVIRWGRDSYFPKSSGL